MSDHNHEILDDGDELAALFGGTAKAKTIEPPKTFVSAIERSFTEPCRDCNGSGRWGHYGNRPCFKCEGTGKLTFKTSPEQRAKYAVVAKAKAIKKANDLATNVEQFTKDHPDVYAWLLKSAPNFPFAKSLLEALLKWGGLTDGQLNATYRCVERYQAAIARNQEKKANAPTVSTTKLEEAFAKATAKAQRPGQIGVWLKPLHLHASNKVDLTFSLGTHKWAGMIFVKSNDGERKIGHIQNGKFVRRYECTDAEEAAVIDCCNDPLKAAIAYGKAWSCCSVCNRTLTDPKSIERGIGPICAAKFGW